MAISRGRYDAQIYTNDAETPGEALSRDVSKKFALAVETSSGPEHNQGLARDQSEGSSRITPLEKGPIREHTMER